MNKLDAIAEADASGRIDYKANQAQDAKEQAIATVKKWASTPLQQIPRLGMAIDPKTGQIFYGEAGEDSFKGSPRGYPYKWMQPGGPAESIKDGDIIRTSGLQIVDKNGYAFVDPQALVNIDKPTPGPVPAQNDPGDGGVAELNKLVDQLAATIKGLKENLSDILNPLKYMKGLGSKAVGAAEKDATKAAADIPVGKIVVDKNGKNWKWMGNRWEAETKPGSGKFNMRQGSAELGAGKTNDLAVELNRIAKGDPEAAAALAKGGKPGLTAWAKSNPKKASSMGLLGLLGLAGLAGLHGGDTTNIPPKPAPGPGPAPIKPDVHPQSTDAGLTPEQQRLIDEIEKKIQMMGTTEDPEMNAAYAHASEVIQQVKDSVGKAQTPASRLPGSDSEEGNKEFDPTWGGTKPDPNKVAADSTLKVYNPSNGGATFTEPNKLAESDNELARWLKIARG